MASNRLALLALLGLSACASAPEQEAVGLGELPPISRDYKGQVIAWAQGFFADRRALRQPVLSEPVLIRDSTGRLLYLVCLEVVNTASGARADGPERFALGFARNYFSAPLQRFGSSLTNQFCDERPLAFRPFPEIARR